ncbi:hypothetical protein L2E82_37507 [Cichorium intybus]|uniref:Uncharacterized protein n=1 Tax=Cichorium intybus TaxID=13427 RepID=A0ACB9AFG4_CICIN|nr:hypothetical protein L2E82_37507 [Cichorium intybus]
MLPQRFFTIESDISISPLEIGRRKKEENQFSISSSTSFDLDPSSGILSSILCQTVSDGKIDDDFDFEISKRVVHG